MKHPYKEHETSKLWEVVKSSIEDLVENNDIELSNPIEYVVGYITDIGLIIRLSMKYEPRVWSF